MRFRLSLTPIDGGAGNSLPIDYQYMQSAVIYKILASSDEAYSSWLHDNGYQLDNGKRFKLFCYSRFRFATPYYIDTKKKIINVGSQGMQWTISFLPERSTQEFVQGLFNGTQFTIGDYSHHITLQVRSVAALSDDIHSIAASATEAAYTATSPVCVKQHTDGHTQYLSPTDTHYSDGILKGLLSRYEALHGKPFGGDTSSFRFDLLNGKAKSKLVDIKGIKIRGYLYSFRLTAPPALHHIAYDGGIGEQCSQGFGFIEKKGK